MVDIKWCSKFNKDHTKQCMFPENHKGMCGAIDPPNYQNVDEPVKGWWWDG